MDERKQAQEFTNAWRKERKPALMRETVQWFFTLVIDGAFLYASIGLLLAMWSETGRVDIFLLIAGPVFSGIIGPVFLIVSGKDILGKWIRISQEKRDRDTRER